MGKEPINTWRGLGTLEGNTRPGQSESRTVLVRKMVWKCFVWPGVRETETCFRPSREFIRLLLPTLGWPSVARVSKLSPPPGDTKVASQINIEIYDDK